MRMIGNEDDWEGRGGTEEEEERKRGKRIGWKEGREEKDRKRV